MLWKVSPSRSFTLSLEIYYPTFYGILLQCLGCCCYLLLGYTSEPFEASTKSCCLYTSSVIRQKGESQNGSNMKTKYSSFFWKICRALFSCYICFETRPFLYYRRLDALFEQRFLWSYEQPLSVLNTILENLQLSPLNWLCRLHPRYFYDSMIMQSPLQWKIISTSYVYCNGSKEELSCMRRNLSNKAVKIVCIVKNLISKNRIFKLNSTNFFIHVYFEIILR